MDLNHLHINAPDVDAQAEFYQLHFGFTSRQAHGKGYFLFNDCGFMLAINPMVEKPVMPSWFHFGFRLETAAKVRECFAKLEAHGATIKVSLQEFDQFIFFRAIDPAGYEIEVYWEPI